MIEGNDDLVRRLVAIHGEGGVCPTAGDWSAILDCDDTRPLTLLNLLKFKPEVRTPDATASGFQAYARYSAEVGPAFTRVGGKLVFFGRVGHIFPSVPGIDWDAAVITRYPTPRAVAELWLDEEFIAAHAHRVDGVAASQVIVMSAIDGTASYGQQRSA